MFSHTVGMAVHDVGSYAARRSSRARSSRSTRSCGCREENLYLRYEDTVVVTETGVENFTDFLPMELDDIEKLVHEKGSSRKCRLSRRRRSSGARATIDRKAAIRRPRSGCKIPPP